jgi:hypothetical protein
MIWNVMQTETGTPKETYILKESRPLSHLCMSWRRESNPGPQRWWVLDLGLNMYATVGCVDSILIGIDILYLFAE